MAHGSRDEGGLLAMIVDQDTATGMLLTGIGHVDIRRRSNFLIVDDSELSKVKKALKSSLLACGELECGLL